MNNRLNKDREQKLQPIRHKFACQKIINSGCEIISTSAALTECTFMDNESGHMEADVILKDIAISAANNQLTTTEVLDLIDIWNKVGKWYA